MKRSFNKKRSFVIVAGINSSNKTDAVDFILFSALRVSVKTCDTVESKVFCDVVHRL